MPSIQERIVATVAEFGPNETSPNRPPTSTCWTLTARGDPDAARMLSRLEAGLAKEFACYLDLAIGGELRYAMHHLGKEALPAELACFFAWRATGRQPSSPASNASSTTAFGFDGLLAHGSDGPLEDVSLLAHQRRLAMRSASALAARSSCRCVIRATRRL